MNLRIIYQMVCIGMLCCLQSTLYAQWKNVPDKFQMPPHPRILLTAGEEQSIKDNIASDANWAKIHQAILNECEKIFTLPDLTYKKEGKRLLGVSREALRRIFYLSYAYRMTGKPAYADCAKRNMLAVSAFANWNPSHFLDVAEMTLGLAIGYDWLFGQLNTTEKEQIRKAIITNGIDASFQSKDAWYKTATHNWNQVCNAGISFGVLAVFEDIPQIAKSIIDDAVESIKLPMKDYEPDGAYPEGYGYWEYGTTFNVLFISAIEKAYGQDFGLLKSAAFLRTAAYQQQMTGISHLCYNYCDCGLGGSLSPAMFWFASRLKQPSLLWNEKHYLSGTIPVRDRILPAALLWGKDLKLDNIPQPEQLMWVGHGTTPVALMRTSWTDPKAIYVGFKGGTGSSNHAHLDAGSFVMEANGVRWASDFGMQNYNSLESKGVDLWNRAQNSQRWEVFRYNNYAHNTLTIDGQLQQVDGYADLLTTSNTPKLMSAKTDLTAVYKGQIASAWREVAIVDGKYVSVRDELKALDKPTTVRWTMMTTATAHQTKDGFELRKDGKRLKLKVDDAKKVTFKTWSTQSKNDFDAPNPGTSLIGFEFEMPAGSQKTVTVQLIPQGVK